MKSHLSKSIANAASRTKERRCRLAPCSASVKRLTCTLCNGKGWRYVWQADYVHKDKEECCDCNGTGIMPNRGISDNDCTAKS